MTLALLLQTRDFWEGPFGHFIIESIPVMLTIVGVGFGIARKMGILDTIMRNFPPHRHEGPRIVYPAGLSGDGLDKRLNENGE